MSDRPRTPVDTRLLRRPGEEGRRHIGPALARLEADIANPDAQFILRALLSRHDLDEAASARTVDAALAWVDCHSQRAEARLVLCGLLERYDLDDTSVARMVTATLAWLDRHGADEESDFVIRALLLRGDLDGEHAAHARVLALVWLNRHGATTEAQFVLHALLEREDLEGSDVRHAVTAALAWLDQHLDLEEASFVLPLVLRRKDLQKAEAKRAVAAAVTWLERHGTSNPADFVFNALLRSSRVPKDQAHFIGTTALTWFQNPPPGREKERRHTLLTLLRRTPLFDDRVVRASVDEACRWLPTAGLSPDLMSTFLFELHRIARRVDRVAEVRALAQKAPPGVEIPKVSRSQFQRLADDLVARARDGGAAPVDVAALRGALAETQRQCEQGAALVALSALPALLPLAARSGSEAIFADAEKIAAEVLQDDALDSRHIRGTLHACRKLLDAWPDAEVGERVLERLDPTRASGGR